MDATDLLIWADLAEESGAGSAALARLVARPASPFVAGSVAKYGNGYGDGYG